MKKYQISVMICDKHSGASWMIDLYLILYELQIEEIKIISNRDIENLFFFFLIRLHNSKIDLHIQVYYVDQFPRNIETNSLAKIINYKIFNIGYED